MPVALERVPIQLQRERLAMAKKKKKRTKEELAKLLDNGGYGVFDFESEEHFVQIVMSLTRAFVCNDLLNEVRLVPELTPSEQCEWVKEFSERLAIASAGPPNQFIALMAPEIVPYEQADGFCRSLLTSYASMPVLEYNPEPEGPAN